MYQTGYIECEIWEDGFVDPAIWYTVTTPADITSGSYDDVALTITANGVGFRGIQGSGALYYRQDGGVWIPASSYNLWSSNLIIANVTELGYGVYDLKVVNNASEEDILLNAFTVVPPTSTTYYSDYNVVPDGSGTEASPWSLTQLRAYFNSDTGYYPINGDIIYVKGNLVTTAGDAVVFTINVGDDKTIYLRAWDKATNGMHTITVGKEGIDIFSYAATNSNVRIIVEDVAILMRDWPGPSSNTVNMVK